MATEDYSPLLRRIEQEIGLKDLTKEKLEDYIKSDTPKRRRLIQEILTTFAVTIGEKFARERGINLSNKTRAKREKWGKSKRERIVIRDNKGRFLAWRYY